MRNHTTAARRELLLLLLGQMERGTITDRDRTLIKPLVEAEMATFDQVDELERVLAIAEREPNPEMTTDPYADGWNECLSDVRDILGATSGSAA